MKKNRRRLRPTLDALEAREVMATLVSLWPDPQHLTLSFAADGVKMGTQVNSINKALAAQFGTTDAHVWQKQVLRAAQTWEAATNVNIGVVADGGQDFGTGGAPQGDSRFGDIRIGADPQSAGVLGLTQPPSLVSGTWGGDIAFNSAATYGNGTTSATDLYTVALHEMGHALGLDDNSTDTGSAMYDTYLGPRAGINAADVAAIQVLYGVRHDSTGGAQGNASMATATPIAYDSNFSTSKVQTVAASIASQTDVDYYSFTVPQGYSTMQVRLQVSGTSALLGRISVYDGLHNLVGTAAATDPLAGDISVALSGLTANATYFVKVQGASDDAFGIGAFKLQLDYRGPTVQSPWASLFSFLNINTSIGTLATAQPLAQNDPTVDPRFQYTYKGSISQVNQVNMYRVSRPANAPPDSTLTATTWGLEVQGLRPYVAVYDSLNRRVAATVLFNESGTYTVQVPHATDTTYTIAVQAQGSVAAFDDGNSQGLGVTGNFFLGIDFGNPPTTLDVLGSGRVARGVGGTDVAITAKHDDLFHFALTGSAASSTRTSVVMTIYDSQGRSVASLSVGAQQTKTLTIFLAAGTYTARFAYQGVYSDDTNSWSPPLSYALTGADLSDPIRVYSATSSGSTPVR